MVEFKLKHLPKLIKSQIAKLPPFVMYTTDNLDIFSFPVGNRPVNRNKVERMKKRFEVRYVITEVVKINAKGEILDGQHLFLACKESGRPIPFVFDPVTTIEDTQEISKNRNAWTALDFSHSYADLGSVEYKALVLFKEKWQIPLGLAQVLLTGSVRYNYAALRNREFKCTHFNWATRIMKMLAELGELINDRRLVRNERFLLAMARALDDDDFILYQFVEKVKLQPRSLVRCATVHQYLEMIEEIYNYKRFVGKVNFS